MITAFGVINASDRVSRVEGLEDYRPVGAFSFIGRYRVIDFMISNMSNSGIDQIKVFTGSNPLPITEHVGSGRQYNINSKRGHLHILFSKHAYAYNLYNTGITSYKDNIDVIEQMPQEYVVIAPSYMVYTADYAELLQTHVDSGADITMLYQSVDTAREEFLTNYTLTTDKDRRVTSFEPNNGAAKSRNIFMDTYIMKKTMFLVLIERALKTSSLYSLANIVADSLNSLDVRGVPHKGYLASINDFLDYYEANMRLINYDAAQDLFKPGWTIYTRTNDSPPTRYLETAIVTNSIVSNGSVIEGTVENSIIGRNCVIERGAKIKNCIILGSTRVGRNTLIENHVVDKHVRIDNIKKIVGDASYPGYVRRGDRI
ncbi:MAG: glucose-1-phosphate adenylyltransferase subunit GlgD [Lachnospiraceae bacterium]|nr:glucose-1-phosphate adenylyltransferase subunit GlgD [Lachnospiraceae bacterium]